MIKRVKQKQSSVTLGSIFWEGSFRKFLTAWLWIGSVVANDGLMQDIVLLKQLSFSLEFLKMSVTVMFL